MVSSIKFDNCVFSSNQPEVSLFIVEKPFLGPFIEVDISEVRICTAIISLLSNKSILFQSGKVENGNVVLIYQIEKGNFSDVANSKTGFDKLMTIERAQFQAFINSSRAFHDSLLINSNAYSASFALLIYALESMANVTYSSMKSKRNKLVRFTRRNVISDMFIDSEIRDLSFTGKVGNLQLLFKKLIERSYLLRCNYVHSLEGVPVLCRVADDLGMAFISNDQKTLFPSYLWLRRISHLALSNFLSSQASVGTNKVLDYLNPLLVGNFKAKKAFPKGQLLNESYLYLQQLTDDFLEEDNLKKQFK